MNLERLVGASVFIFTLFFFILIFYPEDRNLQLEFEQSDEKKSELLNSNNDEVFFENFSESDFDFYVYRAHVLSSKSAIQDLIIKINNGGFPAFFEPLESNEKLFVLYVGPFLLEDDIVDNMEAIQRLSESQNGEITRWKL